MQVTVRVESSHTLNLVITIPQFSVTYGFFFTVFSKAVLSEKAAVPGVNWGKAAKKKVTERALNLTSPHSVRTSRPTYVQYIQYYDRTLPGGLQGSGK